MFPEENIKNTLQTRDRFAFCSTEKNSIEECEAIETKLPYANKNKVIIEFLPMENRI